MTVEPILFIPKNINVQIYDIEASDNEGNKSDDR